MSQRHAIDFTGAAGNRLVGDLYEAAAPADTVALLLHGGGQTRHSWHGTARRLADHGITAITLDQRGHGDSAWMADAAYGFADFAADLRPVAAAIAARFAVAPVAIGASLGGIAALIAAGETEPPPFAGLVLVDITPRVDPDGIAKVLGFMAAKVDEGFATVAEAADAVAAYLPDRPRPRSLDGLRKNLRLRPDGRWRWHWDPRFLGDAAAASPRQGELTERLSAAARRLRMPVMLVRGGKSELVAEAHAREFLDLVPHAAYADVSGAGHMVAGDRNDAFAAATIDFLQGLRAA